MNSPLLLRALDFHSIIVSHTYSRPILWDASKRRFVPGPTGILKLAPWYGVNIGVILLTGFPSSVYIVLDGMNNRKKHAFHIVAISFVLMCFAIVIPAVNMHVFRDRASLCANFANNLITFSKKFCGKEQCTRVDLLGSFAFCNAIVMLFVFVLLPGPVIVANLDPYLSILEDFVLGNPDQRPFSTTIAWSIIRLICVSLCIFEACLLHQFCMCYLIAFSKCYLNVLKKLKRVINPRISCLHKLTQFRIIHSMDPLSISDLVSWVLGVFYFILIDLYSIVLLGSESIPLPVYLFMPVGCAVFTVGILLCISIPAKSNSECEKLIRALDCPTVMIIKISRCNVGQKLERPRVAVGTLDQLCKSKFYRKLIASVGPITIRYGYGGGHFRKPTTIRYMRSLIDNILNMTLGFKGSFETTVDDNLSI